MMVRDEAAHLPRCVASARSIADEIVVGDTGSVDDTRAIARRLGARVIDLPWNDDFSAARNSLLEQAAGRWILFLDADEELVPFDRRALRDLLTTTNQPGFTVEIGSDRGEGRTETAHIVRLFRRDPAFRYEGRIHESVLGSIARSRGVDLWSPPRSGLHVLHHGYRPELRLARDKEERNRRLLRREIDDRPDDPGPRYLFARERSPLIGGDLLDTAEGRESAAVLRPAAILLGAGPPRGLTDPALALCARFALAAGDVDEAADWLDRLERQSGVTKRGAYARAELALLQAACHRSAWSAAAAQLDAIEGASEGCAAIPTEPEVSTCWRAARLAVCALQQERHEEATRWLAAAEPAERLLVEALAARRQNDPALAIAQLGRLVQLAPRDPRGWWALSFMLAQIGRNEQAKAMRDTALKVVPTWNLEGVLGASGLLSAWRE